MDILHASVELTHVLSLLCTDYSDEGAATDLQHSLRTTEDETDANMEGGFFWECIPLEEYLENLFVDGIIDAPNVAEEIENACILSVEASSTSLDGNETTAPQLSLAEELFLFFIMFNLPHSAMQYLLNLLNRHNVNVPKSLYLLRQCSSANLDVSCIKVSENIAYMSITENVIFSVKKNLLNLSLYANSSGTCLLNIKINVDGLPLYKSSPVNLWPILMMIDGLSVPLPLGLFFGIGKPDLQTFMERLCLELRHLKEFGFHLNEFHIFIHDICFVCDAPARAFVQCIIPHTGYYGCGYCRQKGERVENRTVFPLHDCTLRSDEAYASLTENNQQAASPLTGICVVWELQKNFLNIILLPRKVFV
jgi:hypothetical protein